MGERPPLLGGARVPAGRGAVDLWGHSSVSGSRRAQWYGLWAFPSAVISMGKDRCLPWQLRLQVSEVVVWDSASSLWWRLLGSFCSTFPTWRKGVPSWCWGLGHGYIHDSRAGVWGMGLCTTSALYGMLLDVLKPLIMVVLSEIKNKKHLEY